MAASDWAVNAVLPPPRACAACGAACASRCGACNVAFYCAPPAPCQRTHWAGGHRRDCARLREAAYVQAQRARFAHTRADAAAAEIEAARLEVARLEAEDAAATAAEAAPAAELPPASAVRSVAHAAASAVAARSALPADALERLIGALEAAPHSYLAHQRRACNDERRSVCARALAHRKRAAGSAEAGDLAALKARVALAEELCILDGAGADASAGPAASAPRDGMLFAEETVALLQVAGLGDDALASRARAAMARSLTLQARWLRERPRTAIRAAQAAAAVAAAAAVVSASDDAGAAGSGSSSKESAAESDAEGAFGTTERARAAEMLRRAAELARGARAALQARFGAYHLVSLRAVSVLAGALVELGGMEPRAGQGAAEARQQAAEAMEASSAALAGYQRLVSAWMRPVTYPVEYDTHPLLEGPRHYVMNCHMRSGNPLAGFMASTGRL